MAPRLVVHIGTGKAGSSAVQRFLRVHRTKLEEHNLYYWGLNLEHVGNDSRFPWQRPAGIGLFQRLSVADARQQLRTVLAEAFEQLPADGCGVWSNESIYERPEVYAKELQHLQQQMDIELTIIGYARNHRSYVDSAYKQWGIQHKTYPGRILGFADWARKNLEFLSYGARMAVWDNHFSGSFRLLNYDTAGDIVDHFIATLPGAAAEELRSLPRPAFVNASPSNAVLALFALHNNRFEKTIPPGPFQAVVERHRVLAEAHPPLPGISALFPERKAMAEVEELLAGDIELVNSLLQKHGEPQIELSSKAGREALISESQASTEVLSALLGMIIEQDFRIQRLEKELLSTGAQRD